MASIYFDNNATTPLEPPVLQAMMPFLTHQYGNPSSAHSFGLSASKAVAIAREQVAALVGADAEQVYFCSSATEGINWVLAPHIGNLVTSEAEHAATLKTVSNHSHSQRSIFIKVDEDGCIDIHELEHHLTDGYKNVALMWANNETGVITPMDAVAEVCARYGAALHVDGVQAAGKIHVEFAQLALASMVISSHKLFGPKGAAAIIVRDPTSLPTWVRGGGQERGRRSGTENVAAIVGFGAACELAAREQAKRCEHVGRLRDRLESELLKTIDHCRINGDRSRRLSNTTNIGFEGVDGETLAAMLDSYGIAVSTGSACHSSTPEPSHVLRAMTRSYEKASQCIRFSLSHLNTEDEVTTVVDTTRRCVSQLRQ